MNKGKPYIYLAIYNHLKSLILSDLFKKDDRLPSKRKLADHFKVSSLTVDKAYQELIDEGYVYSIEKKGYYVAKKITLFISKVEGKIIKIESKLKKKFTYDFSTSDVDTTFFPNKIWAKLGREVLTEHKETMLNEIDPIGLYDLRVEIAKHLDLYRGMHINENQIIVGSSSSQLLHLLIELLGRDQNYGIEDPAYPKIYHMFKTLNIKTNYIELDDFGLDVSKLSHTQTNIIHVVPSHQYPYGTLMPIQRRIELLNWVYKKEDRYIIEDDYDSEFKYQGRPISALQGLDKGEKVIYMNTFSKSLAPSFRVAYLFLPNHLMKRFQDVMDYHRCTVPNFEQYILYKFMTKDYFTRYLHKMMKIYKQKLDLVLDITKKYPCVNIKNYESGLHFILSIKSFKGEEEIIVLLEKQDIKVQGMSSFKQNKDKKEDCIELVIGYSGLNYEKLKVGYQLLLDTISKYCVN